MRLRSYASVFGLLGISAVGLVGCPDSGGLSKDAAPCFQAMAIKCEQISTCGGVTALTSLGYSSAADCTKGLQAANCTSAQDACDPGTNCLDSLRAQSCADFSSGVRPAACIYACIPGGGGTGGDVGLSELAACNEAIAAICEQTSLCGGTLALAKLGYSTTSDCTGGLQNAKCASQAGCGPGQTFDPNQAKKCIDGFRAESCADFSGGVEPDACSLVCSGGGGGIGGGFGAGGWGGDVGGQSGWGGSVGGFGSGGWGGDVGGHGGWGGSAGVFGSGGWGGDVGGQGGWGGAAGNGGWGGGQGGLGVAGAGGWGGDVGGQSGANGWPLGWP